ncbi:MULTISPECIES: phage tail protein [unclassified Pseudomonas]|uniref:phage tail-collar fiber domain-containing protein n=1 Tax=unclassified Pseudomonas TaxID=196821 RepID=UPI0011A16C4E|nr:MULTISPECIES: phage tail protein [unclassified Pseudomonas]TWC06441.1 tail collar domain [Pseudomonas sp. SJZ075]TWC25368.1 tail collar domain [Pseudomonas sp. SJZ078]TWC44278.1 tail collar domain [Pseudomonas sp. SJZ124]TWC79521.1 tail collar domain [Pseudomonas sp. SJZ101]
MADYYTLLTDAGIAYETACKAAGTPIKLSQISVGDGGGAVYNPAATATALKREVWRGPLNALFQDEKNPSWLLAEVTIPPEVGGWYVREAGIWTDTGVLYAIVKYPESFKPVLATSGSGKEFYIRSIFETSNAALVTLLIDDTVVKATRAWVMSYLADELAKLDGKQSVRVATTGNIVLSGLQQIDGIAVVAGQRVLVTAQTTAKENGIYVVASGAWMRSVDSNTSAKVTPGLMVMVEEGIANGDSLWHLVTNGPIALGTTALSFEMLAGRTGILAGTYRSLTVDKYGRATGGSNPETLAGFGIKDTYTKPEIESMIAQASALPVGVVVAFPVDKVAPGFLELDGSVKSITAYPDLASFLGTIFNKGDEGAGNFRLPESRGEFLRGWDHERGVDVGRTLGSFQKGSLVPFDPTSAASAVVGLHSTGSDATIRSDLGLDGLGAADYPGADVVYNAASALLPVSSSTGVTRPRNLSVMWCIKAWNAPINQGNIDIAALQALAAQATETNRGTAKIATQSLTNVGIDDATIVTPKKLRWGVSLLVAPNGYLAFPSWLGGLIIQWATTQITTNGANGGTATVTLPMAFPNASFGVLAIRRTTNFLNGGETYQAAPSGLAQAVISIDSASGNEGAGARDVFYLALGN